MKATKTLLAAWLCLALLAPTALAGEPGEDGTPLPPPPPPAELDPPPADDDPLPPADPAPEPKKPAEPKKAEAKPAKATPKKAEAAPMKDDTGQPMFGFDKVLIQLNWGDDNLLLGAGETRENSPEPNFGRCSRTQIDGIVRADCAEGGTRLGLYKKIQINPEFAVAGALVIGMNVNTDPESAKAGQVALFDLGSYLRIAHKIGDDGAFFADLYPVDARPLTLGFHPDIEWGTRDEFPRNFRRGLAPGLKIGITYGDFYFFAGAKSALIKSPLAVELTNEGGNRILFSTRTYYGVLGGFGWAPKEGFKAEVNGGFFHKGTLSKEGVLGKDILSGGVSTRLAYADGEAIGARIDSGLYQRSATGARTIRQASYAGELAWALALEGTMRVQNLSDIERPGSTKNEFAFAGHLGFKFRLNNSRLFVESRLRSLTYITAEVPGFFPYSTLPEAAQTAPEVQTLIAFDQKIGPVTVGLTAGIRLPATYEGLPPQGASDDPATAGSRVVVVSDADAGGWYILPAGIDARIAYWVELAAKWQPVEEFAIIAEVLYGNDSNRTQVERDSQGHAVRVFTQPHVVGINLLGQLLF